MAAFEYKAINAKGKNAKGIIEADSAKGARQALREKGLIPVEVTTSVEKEKKQGSNKSVFQKGVSASDLALITRQLSTLSASGLPIEESLLAVAQQCDKSRHESIIMAVRSKVTEGYSLADSLAEFPHVFDDLYRSMVAAGEKSGHLDTVLERLADYTERRQHTKEQIQQASIYPTMLAVVATAVISYLLASVVPKIVSQFTRMNADLPINTQIMIAMSEFVQNYGLFLLIFILGALVLFNRIVEKPEPKLKWHKILLKLPIVGKVVLGLNTARFARTLSICTASAVPLLESMRIASDVLSNEHMKLVLDEARSKVREGSSLRASLEQTKLFAPMMLHMIASGEKSGELEQMLTRAADNQDREFESLVNVTIGILGPAMVLTMAGFVFFIVLSILQPILALNQMVG